MVKEYEQFITPETRLGTLLKTYPKLEPVLIDMSPAFAKLRNPVLRKTIAKVTTLRQVARIGDLPLADLINKLRAEVGFQNYVYNEQDEQKVDGAPNWFDPKKIKKSLDARPMLEAGEHPLNQVLTELKEFKPNQVYELVTPFLPAPLIDAVKGKGFLAWSKQEKPDLFKNYFVKAE